MATAACVTEKPNHHQNQQQQVLKCPRCHSSNTKFCYYNNYSLSQPRHFCKGCKRYWTRGGTLRNVPVGGGCRKNKRIKKPFTSTQTNRASSTLATVVHNPNPNPNPNPNSKPNLDDLPSSPPSKNNSNHHLNPLFQGLLPQNPKYPRFVSRVSNGYDHLQPDLSSLGLGFSSSYPGAPVVSNDDHNSTSIASRCPSIFSVGSTSNCTSDPTMASLFSSSLQQQPRNLGFVAYEDGGGSGTQYRMDWNNNFHGQNDNDHIKAVESSDPNSFLWNTTIGDGGDWLDPTSNIGSSVPSLI